MKETDKRQRRDFPHAESRNNATVDGNQTLIWSEKTDVNHSSLPPSRSATDTQNDTKNIIKTSVLMAKAAGKLYYSGCKDCDSLPFFSPCLLESGLAGKKKVLAVIISSSFLGFAVPVNKDIGTVVSLSLLLHHCFL